MDTEFLSDRRRYGVSGKSTNKDLLASERLITNYGVQSTYLFSWRRLEHEYVVAGGNYCRRLPINIRQPVGR